MYKLVLVDDEMLVRLGLRSAIDWNEEGFEIVGEASGGRDGIRVIRSTRPDLVISDIVMPEMDGIEMYQELKKEGIAPIFIVLSSYDQFDMVKRAMKAGARDYLLKLQLNGQSLHELLSEIRGELDAKQGEERAGSGEDGVQTDEMELNRIYLYALLLGEKVNASYLRHCFTGSGGRARVFYVATDSSRIMVSKTERERNVYSRAIGSLLDEIAGEFGEAYCIEWENGNFVVVAEAGSALSEDICREMAKAIAVSLENYGNLQCSIGISVPVEILHIQEAYGMAKLISEDLKYNGYGSIRFYTPGDGDSVSGEDEELDEMIDLERLRSICELLNEGELRQYFNECNFKIKSHRLSLEKAAFQSSQLICVTEEYLKRNWENIDFENKGGSFLAQIYRSQSVSEILRCNREYVNAVEKTISEFSSHDSTRIARDVKNYVKLHINDPIGLTEIAEALNVSPSYLSATFSQSESIGIINYINREKIHRAKYLMLAEHLKVYEVSYMLGFENASYFAKVFKKYAGCTPKQFASGRKGANVP